MDSAPEQPWSAAVYSVRTAPTKRCGAPHAGVTLPSRWDGMPRSATSSRNASRGCRKIRAGSALGRAEPRGSSRLHEHERARLDLAAPHVDIVARDRLRGGVELPAQHDGPDGARSHVRLHLVVALLLPGDGALNILALDRQR